LRAAGRLPVPLLLLEPPASPCPPEDADEIVATAASGGRVVRIPDRSPETVASALVRELVGEEYRSRKSRGLPTIPM
jgi:hypothetical protein